MRKALGFVFTLWIFSLALCACHAKQAEDAPQEAPQGKMAAAKDHYEEVSAKVAAMREEAATLRMTGQADDQAKAVQLEQKAAQLEQEALKDLNPSL